MNTLLVITNLSVIPTIIKFVQIGDIVDAFLFFVLMIVSMFYHGCKDLNACITNIKILSFMDVLLASSLGICLSLQYASSIHKISFIDISRMYRIRENKDFDINRQLKTVLTLLLLIINGIWLSLNDGNSSVTQKIFTLVYCLFMIIYALMIHLQSKDGILINTNRLIMGVIISVAGYILFEIAGIDKFGPYYYISHSLWHVLSSIGLYILITATIYNKK